MSWYLIMGYIATAVFIIMYIPQTVSVIKNKSAGSLSKFTFVIIWLGCLMWTFYAGIEKQDIAQNIPAFLTDSIITLLMFPIVWYLFQDSEHRVLIFVAVTITTIVLLTLSSIIMFDRKLLLNPNYGAAPLGYLFVSLGGLATSFSFTPQMIKIVKENRVGDIRILSTILIITANILWIIFWIGHYIYSGLSTNILTISISVVACSMQLPILYVYIKNRKKTRM